MTDGTTGTGGRDHRRGSFGAVTLTGLAAGVLTAVAGTRAAVSVDADGQAAALVTAGTVAGDALTMPLVTSLALVALAAWGVLLVTRGRVRRGAAVLALVASGGALAAAVVARGSLGGTVDEALDEVGATGSATTTGWYVAGLLGAVLLTVAAAAAVRLVPSWPEMGRRYDTPAGAAAADAGPGEGGDSSLDLWKAMDEGRDPTDRPTDDRAP